MLLGFNIFIDIVRVKKLYIYTNLVSRYQYSGLMLLNDGHILVKAEIYTPTAQKNRTDRLLLHYKTFYRSREVESTEKVTSFLRRSKTVNCSVTTQNAHDTVIPMLLLLY